MSQPNLLDRLPRNFDWQPPELRSLDGEDHIAIDTETSGVRWWDSDYAGGVSVCPFRSREPRYYPWLHYGGGNLQKEQVLRWMKFELRNKHLYGLNIRFDVQMIRKEGVDLEAQGCTVTDVGHLAALLDDSRMKFNLDILVRDFLDQEKVGSDLVADKMLTYHAGEVASRAEADVRQVMDLYEVMWPKIEEEGLEKVSALEDKIIWVVCEMERNGAPLDVESLKKWDEEAEQKRLEILYRLYRLTGFEIDPDKPRQMVRLFEKLNISLEYTERGNPSFTSQILRKIEHPAVKMALQARQLKKLRSKFLTKYVNRVGSDGILRYALHQLRATKDDLDDSLAGTVSGRFSSTAIIKNKEGDNVQAVLKPSKQVREYGDEYIVRELYVPRNPGWKWISADASQIEYRLFAHFANNPEIIAKYREDPTYSFHKMIHEKFLVYKPDLTYKRAKDNNFANIYGAGLLKTALMMEYITAAQYRDLLASRDYRNPLLDEVKKIRRIYRRELPEAHELLNDAMERAQENEYVTTILGRRSRFITHSRYHKALNCIIQGSAADIMKQKLVELHENRKHTCMVMRFTVHDEVDGDVPDREHAERVKAILNEQSFDLRVPILWDISVGDNWRECSD